MKRKLKMILIIIAIVIGIVVVGTALFLNLSPQFGASKQAIQTSRVLNSPNFRDGKFVNAEETVVMTNFKISTLPEYFTNEGKVPDFEIPVEKILPNEISNFDDSLTRVTWFGHSTILLETAGKTIFIDPMLGMVPAPVSWAGSSRFNPNLPIDIEALPFIDVVLISHDHYDHLDYGSIMQLKEKVGKFYVPLGVGAHLRSWGVAADKISEMDLWDSETFGELTFISTPSRHFSGRGLFDRSSTLWCSWVIQTENTNIFFSGDGGYGNHFKKIGDKFGPFDFAMMECGQYNEQWSQIHLLPEEVPQALLDLQCQVFMPIHWGAFKLALHDWAEPVESLKKAINSDEVTMATPKIGEQFIIGESIPMDEWWKK